MRCKLLRSHLTRNAMKHEHTLQDCELVIDGKSCFRDAYSYKKSGCQFILGGEYDRYANYLKNVLKPFIESNITCLVIINGGMHADIELRKEIHQKIIDNTDAVHPGRDDNIYCEPVFVKDVQRHVLEELGINYLVTEFDSREAMFSVAKYFDCPILTNNIEYRLYGVTCIVPDSITYNKESSNISCNISRKTNLYMDNEMVPIFLTLIDEESPFFKKLPLLIGCREKNLISSALWWATRQSKDDALKSVSKSLRETERNVFMKNYEEHAKLFKSNDMMAVKYFETGHIANDYFLHGVATGKIAVPYINLKNNGTFSGSWLIVDKKQDDAMLPAIDIVLFVYAIFMNAQNVKITFIGRKFVNSQVWEIEGEFNTPLSTEGLFDKIKKSQTDAFRAYVEKILPGFDFKWLHHVPEETWILIITCLYFCKRNKGFINFAYSCMFSYVMLGPVSEKVGVIKKSNFVSLNEFDDVKDQDDCYDNNLSVKACAFATIKLIDLFYADKVKSVFNRSILHTLAEFQHYLQHINFLNKICGEKIKCTVYHKVLNVTFVYNVYLKMGTDRSLKFFEGILGNSPVLEYFKKMLTVFEDCLKAI